MANILVIDNNSQDARLAKKLLTNAGHDVVIAPTGRSGLNLFGDVMPDLLLIDTNLPDIDAQRLIGLIHQSYPQNNTPIIAYTAWSEDTARRLIETYDLNGAILKPINTHQFVYQVNSQLLATATI